MPRSSRAADPAWSTPSRASPPPWRVLATSLAVTVALTAAYQVAVDRRDELRLAGLLRSTEDSVQGRLDTYVALLVATRGLVVAAEPLTVARFHAFVGELGLDARYPGIQGIGFSRRFRWADRDALTAELEASGQSGVVPWLDTPRDEAEAIVLLEPMDRRNVAALGYDMSTEPTRREAMERARDTGRAAASALVTLVQEIDPAKQAGFLVYLPVYAGGGVPPTVEARRAALQGYVYSPFRVGDLFEGIFGGDPDPRAAFAIHDDGALLYRTASFRGDRGPRGRSTIEVGGRTWTLDVEATPAFGRTSGRWATPWIALIGGLASLAFGLQAVRQRRAEDLLQLRSRVLESMSEGVLVTDTAGRVLYTNAAEDRMLGHGPGELIGTDAARLVAGSPEDGARWLEEVGRVVDDDGAWSGEVESVRKDGTRLHTEARVTGLDVRGRRCRVAVQEDVTERKQAERQRAELLDRERVALEEARQANRVKDEFLAMLGHELRNPLAPIVTSIELLRRRHGGDDPTLALLARQVAQLRRLVDDLMDVARVARGRIRLERRVLDLRDVIREAVETVTPLVQQRRHTLGVDAPEPLPVDGDAGRLAQVLTNLLTNAAKYTDPGGRIELDARRDRDEGSDEVVVRVRDDGIGIQADALPHLFDLFTQGPRALDRAQGGLGIGLAVVRSLVELHGGHISARSEGPGRGSEFEVRLPAAAPVEAPSPGRVATTGAPRASGLRVLLVDDNQDAALAMAELLRLEGHHVEVAHDATAALALADATRFDIALLDLGLPGVDGYALAARLPEPRPVLFALTGYGSAEDRARTRAAGFRGHFTKPVNPEELLAALAEVAGR